MNEFIIGLYEDYKQHLIMESIDNIEQFNQYGIEMISMLIGKDIKSSQYGYILGFFKYDNEFFEFRYHIHTPNQKYAILSNKMTNLEHIVLKHTNIESCKFAYIDRIHDEYSYKFAQAFWDYTSLKALTEQPAAYALRILMQNITAYSRQQQFCKYFAKNDKKRLKYIKEHENIKYEEE